MSGCWTSQVGYCAIDCDGQHRPNGACCSQCEPDDHCGCCEQFDVEKAIAEDNSTEGERECLS